MAATAADNHDDSEGSAWLLFVSAASCPRSCSSQLEFSEHSIYYLADLLKVISEPSGPAR